MKTSFQEIRFGIDLGGTKIEIIGLAISQEKPAEIVYQKRISTPKGDYLATVEAISHLVIEAESILKARFFQNPNIKVIDSSDAALSKQTNPSVNSFFKVGIAIPGAISYKTGKIKNANSVCLIGQDLQGDLQKRLQRPVKLANDANCFALSEAVDGSAKGASVVFGVIIGTGCGGGLVINGELLNGVNAIAGEWGHNALPWLNPQDSRLECYCGLQGCIETFLSGTGLENHYQQRTGTILSAQQIVSLSEQGDSVAEQLMQDYIEWLAKGLASVINIVDPDVIVLGGGLSNIQRLYTEVPKIWHKWVFSDRVDTELKPPKFGDSSGVRGAAWL